VYVPVAQGIWWGVSKETRKERVPVARAFVGVRNRNQEGEGACCTGFFGGGGGWGVAREIRRERVSHNNFPGILKMP
jgi:hypothetical protein